MSPPLVFFAAPTIAVVMAFSPSMAANSHCPFGEGPVWVGHTGIRGLTDIAIEVAQELSLDCVSRKLSGHVLPERLGALRLTCDSRPQACASGSDFAG